MTLDYSTIALVCNDMLEFFGYDGCPTLRSEIEHYRSCRFNDVECARAREKALEDAARVAEDWPSMEFGTQIAAAIRALKPSDAK